jgi:hypothetical protein
VSAAGGGRPPGGRCSKCGKEIDVRADYREVTGWERIKGGGRSLRLIDRTGQTFTCRWCVERLERGLSTDQGALI